MATYQNLIIWQKARSLVHAVYAATAKFPAQEQFALTSQMNRCVVSIVSNIAEGWARGSTKDFLRFLYMSLGSLAELETQIILAIDLGYLPERDQESVCAQTDEVGRLINSTISTLRSKIASNPLAPNL
ncbi:MAG: four helix bundle protein [bacterium]